MKDLIDFLTTNPVCFFATVEDGHPRVRPFGFKFFEEGRFYFTTSNKKAYIHNSAKHLMLNFQVLQRIG